VSANDVQAPLKIVALASFGHPILFTNLVEFERAGIVLDGVICTALPSSHLELFRSRTAGLYPEMTIADLERADLPFYFVASHTSSKTVSLVRELAPDLLINLGTPNILRNNILSIPRLGTLNCHPGILPGYRGCTCLEWSVYFDDPVGATCHFMTEGIDEGPIVTAKAMEVVPGTSYEKVRADIVNHATEVMIEGISILSERRIGQDMFPAQAAGTYHQVIGEDKLALVKERLASGAYTSP